MISEPFKQNTRKRKQLLTARIKPADVKGFRQGSGNEKFRKESAFRLGSRGFSVKRLS